MVFRPRPLGGTALSQTVSVFVLHPRRTAGAKPPGRPCKRLVGNSDELPTAGNWREACPQKCVEIRRPAGLATYRAGFEAGHRHCPGGIHPRLGVVAAVGAGVSVGSVRTKKPGQSARGWPRGPGSFRISTISRIRENSIMACTKPRSKSGVCCQTKSKIGRNSLRCWQGYKQKTARESKGRRKVLGKIALKIRHG